MRFDNVPSGWSGSSTERFSGWDIIPTQVPYATQTLTEDSGLGCFYPTFRTLNCHRSKKPLK
ncbi:MAG: hypothetical protein EWV61_05020 [Microcystis aeruginosa Ma_AC_P_19900807_S300]|nr:MAG: hypothetical protein EWV61_05020 [Microcystis aeruginosa Ma_AC_P_19900807_S300]